MTHLSGPCGWEVDICDACCTDAVSALSAERLVQVKDWAVDFLWRATGRKFGLCEQTYRPCSRDCGGGSMYPGKINGQWVNFSCSSCPGACGCGRAPSEVYLPGTQAVTGLVIDGLALDPFDEVLVYDHSRIMRTNGESWPTCQDLGAASDAVSGVAGTWQITVLSGFPVPAGGAIAAGILACEFAKACTGIGECRLPKRIQTISRNGVTVGFQDMFEGLGDLRTGIWEIDAFIEASRASRWAEPSIGSMDLPDHPQLTWPLL